ncbi:DUF6973 domain-containing protein [Ferrovibrio sp.]|uniref:DUF6973 domain-containing protein n=1 Tax=Ferrovibrio sp. TaxID=1917215 RepID=UPI003D2E11A8
MSEEKLAYLMRDKRYWHPRHADPAYQAMITEGFRRLYPSPNQAAGGQAGADGKTPAGSGGPVHVDAHRRDGSDVREHFRSLPGQGGTGDMQHKKPVQKPEELDGMRISEIEEALSFDPNGMRESELHEADSFTAFIVKGIAAKHLYGPMYIEDYRIEPGRPHNNADDAVRHALWSFEMTKYLGADTAKKYGDAHERIPNNPTGEKAMDLFNNAVGRQLALEAKQSNVSARQVVLEALRNGRLRTRPVSVAP